MLVDALEAGGATTQPLLTRQHGGVTPPPDTLGFEVGGDVKLSAGGLGTTNTRVAGILLLSALALWGLKAAGFRFNVSN